MTDFTASGQRCEKIPTSLIEASKASRPALTVPKTTWFLSTRLVTHHEVGIHFDWAFSAGNAGKNEYTVGAQ